MNISISTHLEAMPSTPVDSSHSTCQAIRETALAMFAEHGFQAVSLRKLASALGLHPGSLYCHIKNKHALLFELIEDYEDDLLEALQTRVPDSSPAECLKAYVQTSLTHQRHNLQRATLVKHEYRNLLKDQIAYIKLIKNEQQILLENIVSRCLDALGEHPNEDITTLCQCIKTILDGVPDWQLQNVNLPLTVIDERIYRLIRSLLNKPQSAFHHINL
jgi:AcrR family transcriptional regulator